MTAKVKLFRVVELKVNSGDTSGESLLNRAIKELEIWGGMSHSDAVIDDEGRVSISFDPETVFGDSLADKLDRLIAWAGVQGQEWELTFSQLDMNR